MGRVGQEGKSYGAARGRGRKGQGGGRGIQGRQEGIGEGRKEGLG